MTEVRFLEEKKSRLVICIVHVEYILIGYNVLMITNLNDLYTWVSCPNRLKTGPISGPCYSWRIVIENWLKSRPIHCLQEQDKIMFSVESNKWFPEQAEIREPGWSMRQVGSCCTKFSSHLGCFKNLCNSYWLIFFIDSCVNAKQESLNYIHTKERFSWKRLGTLSQKEAENNVSGCS